MYLDVVATVLKVVFYTDVLIYLKYCELKVCGSEFHKPTNVSSKIVRTIHNTCNLFGLVYYKMTFVMDYFEKTLKDFCLVTNLMQM